MHRDPQTGKFVSSGSGDTTRVQGVVTTTLPAADLSGGTQQQKIEGEAAEIVDFTQLLDSDEIFEADEVRGVASLQLPTTATAESSAEVIAEVRTDFGEVVPGNRSVHYGGSIGHEEGIADIGTGDQMDPSCLHGYWMHGSADVGDSTNGLGIGPGLGYHEFQFGVADVAFDRDDELTNPHIIRVDNASDHAVLYTAYVNMQGRLIRQ